jgi:caa(3)-type oxidase subunit IV
MSASESRTKTYLAVWVILAVFTALEIGAATLLPAGTSVRWLSLVILAVAKAAAVGLWYMHLLFERGWLKLIAVTPALAAAYAVVLILEVVAR